MKSVRQRLPAPSTLTYLVGVPTCAVAAFFAFRDSRTIDFPGPVITAVVCVLTLVFLLLAAESYATLIEPTQRRSARASFFSSQLVKYIPAGGVAQFASQASQLDLDGKSGIRIVAESKIIAAAAGLVWGLTFAIFADDAALIWRLGAAAGGVAALSVWTPWFDSLVSWVGERTGAHGGTHDRNQTARSFVLGVASVGAAGIAFALLLSTQTASAPPVIAAVSAYALAWTAGYLAVPFPGGIGVREAVLVLLLPVELGSVLVVAIAVRVIQVGCELVLGLLVAPAMLRRVEP